MSENGHSLDGTDRHCTRCGKSVEDEAYKFWVFKTCRHCAIDADGRFRDCGTYRKWRYFPRWHMTRHPDLPEHKRERYAIADGGERTLKSDTHRTEESANE